MNRISQADQRVRLDQIQQGAEMMALALRSNATMEGEAFAKVVEAIATIVINSEKDSMTDQSRVLRAKLEK